MDIKNELKNFLDSDGRLKQYPAKRRMKMLSLIYLAGFFTPERVYNEREVNGIIADACAFYDPATMRRELYDHFFLDRTRDGREYTLAPVQPTAEQLGIEGDVK